MRLRIHFISLLMLLLGACAHPSPQVEPTEVPLQTVTEQAPNPRRAASMRIVEEGQRALRNSRYERAAQSFSGAIEIDAKNPYAYYYLAFTRYRVDRFVEASELFGRAADLFDDLPDWQAESYAMKGESLEKLGHVDAATQAFKKALSVNGSNTRAREALDRMNP